MFDSIDSFFVYIRENKITFLDFRFTDVVGKFCRITKNANYINNKDIENGLSVDGSSIEGLVDINQSDIVIKPDVATAFLDPFTAHKTLVVICDLSSHTNNKASLLDARSIAKRAVASMNAAKIANKAFFGAELEFFIFDNVQFECGDKKMYAFLDSEESIDNSATEYNNSSNHGHRIEYKKSYCIDSPIDLNNDMRSEISEHLIEISAAPDGHHHEVASAQHEITLKFNDLVANADNIQKAKYVIRNTAYSYGKTATFLPKAKKSDNGNGMHLHNSLFADEKNVFAKENDGAGLSQLCLYYIGGIQKHIKALNAITNPTTLSYKRLIPGFEAPIISAYGWGNRSVAIRIPSSVQVDKKATRIELRFPDCTANPYLASAAILMAGMDGIKNKILPDDPISNNAEESLVDGSARNLKTVALSLEEAVNNLEKDHEFLLADNVFCIDCIYKNIARQRKIIEELRAWPHPKEFINYYNL